mmetsp:Transcript_4333/g.14687  ORF Transcript_4333/g.14687 Transcript_4333/m.14687 type:complete len:273 (+) Transcript_4333:72-890(+)
MRQLMMHVFEPPGQVVWRGLHQLAHLVRRVLLQHVVDVLGVAGSHQRLDKGLRDGDERRAVGLQDGEGEHAVVEELVPLARGGEAAVETLRDRQQVGVEPRARAGDVPKVDVHEDVAPRADEQHVVLVPVGEPEHEAGDEGAGGGVVERARVREVGHGLNRHRLGEQLDEAGPLGGRHHGVRQREGGGARGAPERIHLVEEHEDEHVLEEVVAALVQVAGRHRAAGRGREPRTEALRLGRGSRVLGGLGVLARRSVDGGGRRGQGGRRGRER